MKIIVTTSNNYAHIVPIFIYLFNQNWGEQIELVGYKKPDFDLPANFTFYSLGEQTDTNKDFSNDLRKYFEKQDDYFIWMMEDCFIKSVNFDKMHLAKFMANRENIGRVALTNDSFVQYTEIHDRMSGITVYRTPHGSEYRLSTQPAIWNKKYLLRYLTENLSPWEFESQPKTIDEFINLCLDSAPVKHNEGTTRHNIHKYNLEGIDDRQIEEMRSLGLI